MSNSLPDQVVFLYREVGRTHVFTSKGVKGLVHIGSHSLEKAFNILGRALHNHIKEAYGAEGMYRPSVSFDDFSANLGSNRIGDCLLVMSLEQAI